MKGLETVELFDEEDKNSFEYEIKIMIEEKHYELIERTETYVKLQRKFGFLTDREIKEGY